MELNFGEKGSEIKVNNTIEDIWNNKGSSLDVYFSPDGSNDTSLSFNPNSTSNDINIYYNGTYKIRLSRSFSYDSLKDFGSYTIFLAQAYALLC